MISNIVVQPFDRCIHCDPLRLPGNQSRVTGLSLWFPGTKVALRDSPFGSYDMGKIPSWSPIATLLNTKWKWGFSAPSTCSRSKHMLNGSKPCTAPVVPTYDAATADTYPTFAPTSRTISPEDKVFLKHSHRMRS